MYALNIYHEEALDYISSTSNTSLDTLDTIQEAIKGVIDSLISIELSRKLGDEYLRKYKNY